jgi:hypothetical protein
MFGYNDRPEGPPAHGGLRGKNSKEAKCPWNQYCLRYERHRRPKKNHKSIIDTIKAL